MRRMVAIGLLLSGCAFAQPALVVVLNPEKPEELSQGEVGVMLDAIAKEMNKGKKFRTVPLERVRSVLEGTGLARVGTCPDKKCLRDVALALSADYIVTLSVEKKEEPFEVKLVMYDAAEGTAVAQSEGKFNGPKSQLPLKLIPKRTKELVRAASPLVTVASGPGNVAAPVATEVAEPQTVEPEKEAEAAQPETRAQAPEPVAPEEQPRKSVLRSPGFWIPLCLAIATPVAIVVLVTQVRQSDEEGGDEVPLPDQYPQRPSTQSLVAP